MTTATTMIQTMNMEAIMENMLDRMPKMWKDIVMM